MRPRVVLILGLLLVACRTPDGPRVFLPDQTLSQPTPPGLARVIFFNRSNKALYPTSGSVRIQLDGVTVPTVHHNRYTQVFLEPREYDLLLEHFDLFAYFKGRHRIVVEAPNSYFAVYSTMVSTKFEQVKELPEGFLLHWSPAKYPSQW